MRNIWMKTLGLAACTVVYSHAIFGIGGHWAPSTGTKIGGGLDTVASVSGGNLILDNGGGTGLNGFGAKVWIDVLPFIDIEGSYNLQFGQYDLTLMGPGGFSRELEFDLKAPFGLAEGKPTFFRGLGDLSVLYPVLKLPPLVKIAKLAIGGGVSHAIFTEVLDAKFARKAIAAANSSGTPVTTSEQAIAVLTDAIIDEGIQQGVGFHLMAEVTVKPPIIPVAAYGALKFHMISAMPEAVDANTLSFELGAALAF